MLFALFPVIDWSNPASLTDFCPLLFLITVLNSRFIIWLFFRCFFFFLYSMNRNNLRRSSSVNLVSTASVAKTRESLSMVWNYIQSANLLEDLRDGHWLWQASSSTTDTSMQSFASCSNSHLMGCEELKSRTGKEATVSVSSVVSLSFFPSSSPPAHQLGLIKACPWTNMYLSACSCFYKLNDFGEKLVWIPAKLEQIAKWFTRHTQVSLWPDSIMSRNVFNDYTENCHTVGGNL